MEWKPYLNDRLIAKHPAGFHVIKPVEQACESQPLFCPYCDRIMRSEYDDDAYKKFQCCDICAGAWVYPNLDAWKSGWRPDPQQIRNNCKKSPI
jgi:hypothetical protein